jgi:hypothetical protein
VLATLLCAVLVAWLFLGASPLTTTFERSLGAVGEPTAHGFYRGETTPDGRGFRWTSGDATLTLTAQTPGRHLLDLAIAAPRPAAATTPLTLTIDKRAAVMVQQPNDLRRYHILAAGSWPAQPSTTVRIESETLPTVEAGGRRSLGVVVFAVGWRGLSAPTWLLPLQVAVIAIATGLFALALAAAGAPSWLRVALLIMLVAILLAMRHSDSGFTHRGNAVLMTFALIAFLAAMLAMLRRAPDRDTPPCQPGAGSVSTGWPSPALRL